LFVYQKGRKRYTKKDFSNSLAETKKVYY